MNLSIALAFCRELISRQECTDGEETLIEFCFGERSEIQEDRCRKISHSNTL